MNRLVAGVLVVVAVACSEAARGPEGERGPQGADGSSCTVVEVEPGLRRITCTDGTTVDLRDGEDGATGPKGEDGVDGLDARPCTVASVEGGARITCPDGSEAFVANGIDGTDGAVGDPGRDGAAGTSCSVVTTAGVKEIVCSDGTRVVLEDGADGANGADGAPGAAGLASLVRLDAELPGTNCPTGGTKVSAGLDDDRDGTLDEAEVDAVAWVCSSVPPPTCAVFEGDMVVGNSLDLDAFARLACPVVAGNLFVENVSDLARLAFVRRVEGTLQVANVRGTELSWPTLEEVTGAVMVQGSARLASLSLPALRAADSVTLQDNVLLARASIGAGLTSVGSFTVARNAVLADLAVPGLVSTSQLAIVGNPALDGCRVDALLSQVVIAPGGTVDVRDNGTGCVRAPRPGELVFNEILADPPEDDPLTTGIVEGDANGDGVRESTQDEFVELVNRSNVPLQLAGVRIHRSANGFVRAPATTDKKFEFPYFVLEPGKAVVVFGGGAVPETVNGTPAFRSNQLSLGATSYLSLAVGSTDLDLLSYNGTAAAAPAQNLALLLGSSNVSGTRSPDVTGEAWGLHEARPYSPGLRSDGSAF